MELENCPIGLVVPLAKTKTSQRLDPMRFLSFEIARKRERLMLKSHFTALKFGGKFSLGRLRKVPMTLNFLLVQSLQRDSPMSLLAETMTLKDIFSPNFFEVISV
jgi:hypothetical protein